MLCSYHNMLHQTKTVSLKQWAQTMERRERVITYVQSLHICTMVQGYGKIRRIRRWRSLCAVTYMYDDVEVWWKSVDAGDKSHHVCLQECTMKQCYDEGLETQALQVIWCVLKYVRWRKEAIMVWSRRRRGCRLPRKFTATVLRTCLYCVRDMMMNKYSTEI